jgi:regulator of protease activity HflC (stomatin/prohibitin superfamily)
MADITRYPFLRHLRGTETTYVRHVRNGRILHEGTAGSFWFRALGAAISEVPVDDRELPLLFHAQTVDFQDVAVQATVTFRVAEPALAAQRIDFSVDPDNGRFRASPLEQLTTILTETAQQYALGIIAALPLTAAITSGLTAVREGIDAGLTGDNRLAETGIRVVGARVVAIRPEPRVEQALQTPTRERLQQDADAATFERRAVAVERERAISENELQNQIELARREEQLVAQRGANTRLQAQEAAAANEIETDAEADRTRRLGAAAADSEAARMAAYGDTSDSVLLTLALKELAANLPAIDHLVLTPDLVSPLLARLGAGGRPQES